MSQLEAAEFAPSPAERRGLARDGVRLMVATDSEAITHTRFDQLARHLRPGDVVVVNNSATRAAAVDAVSDRHGPVVVHLATPLDDATWVVEVRRPPDAARAVLDARAGDRLSLAAGRAELHLVEPYPAPGSSPTRLGNRLWRASAVGDPETLAQRHGRPVSYGYLDAVPPLSDYQTIFGTRPGSAEMPSAGRPFSNELVTRLVARGVPIVPVTLHTGVSSQEAGETPQAERYDVPATTATVVNALRCAGGRVIAVGTTVARALESAVEGRGATVRVVARAGWTTRVISPADPPRVTDGLITGWHDPEASHLQLVEAVAGSRLTRRAYTAAAASGYLWHEFGDSCLLLPSSGRNQGSPG